MCHRHYYYVQTAHLSSIHPLYTDPSFYDALPLKVVAGALALGMVRMI
jgi:hypothetical protein